MFCDDFGPHQWNYIEIKTPGWSEFFMDFCWKEKTTEHQLQWFSLYSIHWPFFQAGVEISVWEASNVGKTMPYINHPWLCMVYTNYVWWWPGECFTHITFIVFACQSWHANGGWTYFAKRSWRVSRAQPLATACSKAVSLARQKLDPLCCTDSDVETVFLTHVFVVYLFINPSEATQELSQNYCYFFLKSKFT